MYLINGTVHTMAGPVWNPGFVAFEGGKITGAGAMEALSLPAGAEVLDEPPLPLSLPDETADFGAQPDSRTALRSRPANSRRLENNIIATNFLQIVSLSFFMPLGKVGQHNAQHRRGQHGAHRQGGSHAEGIEQGG